MNESSEKVRQSVPARLVGWGGGDLTARFSHQLFQPFFSSLGPGSALTTTLILFKSSTPLPNTGS